VINFGSVFFNNFTSDYPTGWYYQLNLLFPVGPFETRRDAQAAFIRAMHNRKLQEGTLDLKEQVQF
jgi:hypothetical protein